MGECSRSSNEAIHKVWFDLDFVCSRFVNWRLVCGFSGRDRSDRWERSVRPVYLNLNCPTGQTGPVHRSDRSGWAVQRFVKFLSPLLPRCDLGLLLRDSLSIAILADLGSRVCGDFGTYADVSNFEEILIGSHSPPLWSPVSVPRLVSELG